MRKYLIIVATAVVIVLLGTVYLATNSAPEFMTYRPVYEAGSEVSAFELLTDGVVALTDDRTNVEDLDVVLLENNIVIENLNDTMIDTVDTESSEYKVIVKDGNFKQTEEVLYYDVA